MPAEVCGELLRFLNVGQTGLTGFLFLRASPLRNYAEHQTYSIFVHC